MAVLKCVLAGDMEDTMSEASSFQDLADEANPPQVDWPGSDVESLATEESAWLVVEAEDSETEGWQKEDAPGAPGEKPEDASMFYSAHAELETSSAADDEEEDLVEELEPQEPTIPKQVPELVETGVASGVLLAARPLMLGSNHLFECSGASRDVTHMWNAAFEGFPDVSGAYCLGRVAVAASGDPRSLEALPVVISVVVLNNGAIEWPAGTALRIVAGDAHGFDMMPAGPLPAGHAAELRLDLCVNMDGRDTSCGGTRSAWVLTDECGRPFGPLLVFEVMFM